MDQKCYQGEGWHGLKYMYQGIIISMDSLFGPLLQCTSHQHNVRIVHPTYIYEHCTMGIWVTYRMKMRTGNTFVVLHMYLEISNSHIQGAVLDKQVWLLPGRQHTCTSK